MAVSTTYSGLSSYSTKAGADLQITSVLGGATVTLPGFVTDFSQAFDSTWNEEAVYGRVDPIATFQGTKRTISLSLSMAAGSSQTANKNYNSCRQLMQFLYPGYHSRTEKYFDVKAARKAIEKTNPGIQTKVSESELLAQKNSQQLKKFNKSRLLGRTISKAPLVRVKYANLIQSSNNQSGLLGYFTSLNWSPQIDMGYFTSGKNLVPKVINLSFTFNVLHEHDIGWEQGKAYNGAFPF